MILRTVGFSDGHFLFIELAISEINSRRIILNEPKSWSSHFYIFSKIINKQGNALLKVNQGEHI